MFICSFNKNLSSAFYIPGTRVTVNKKILATPHHETPILVGKTRQQTDEQKILTSDSAKCRNKNNTEKRDGG